MGKLTGRAEGHVHTDDDFESFAFVARGDFFIDGSQLSCEVSGNWDERGLPCVTGDFKITNEQGEFNAKLNGVKDYPGGGAVISAILEGSHGTGVFGSASVGDLEIQYLNDHLEFTLF